MRKSSVHAISLRRTTFCPDFSALCPSTFGRDRPLIMAVGSAKVVCSSAPSNDHRTLFPFAALAYRRICQFLSAVIDLARPARKCIRSEGAEYRILYIFTRGPFFFFSLF